MHIMLLCCKSTIGINDKLNLIFTSLCTLSIQKKKKSNLFFNDVSATIFSRLLNAGGLHSLALQIVATSGISACDVREIAIDGIYLEEPRRPRLGRSLLVSAGRVDWVVRCSNPGTYQVLTSRKKCLSHFVNL